MIGKATYSLGAGQETCGQLGQDSARRESDAMKPLAMPGGAPILINMDARQRRLLWTAWATWLTLVFCFSPELTAGSAIEGEVALGPPPKQPRLNRRYSGSGGASPQPVSAQSAIVYLEGSFSAERLKPPSEPVLLLQKDLRFIPMLLPILVGTKVSFPNEDATYHNVFSYSRIKRFDLGRYRGTEDPPFQIFDQPGVVKVFCEIHNHMRGTILVLKTPHFALTDSEGRYRLEDLPSGSFLLKAWINEREVRSVPVLLKEAEVKTVDFEKE